MARSPRVTLALLIVALAAPAGAANRPAAPTAPTADQKARKLYADGEVAFAAGRYLDAVKSFEEAYQVLHATKLLWNIAQSWQRQYTVSGDLGDLRRAATVLRNYHDLATNVGDRNEANEALAEVDKTIREREDKDRATAAAAAAAVADATAAQSAKSADEQARVARASRFKLAGVVTGVAGMALVSGGIACTVLAQSAFKELNEPATGYIFNPQTESNLHLYRPLGGALLGLGIAAIAGGAALYVLGARERRPTVTIAPTFGRSAAGLLVAGAF